MMWVDLQCLSFDTQAGNQTATLLLRTFQKNQLKICE